MRLRNFSRQIIESEGLAGIFFDCKYLAWVDSTGDDPYLEAAGRGRWPTTVRGVLLRCGELASHCQRTRHRTLGWVRDTHPTAADAVPKLNVRQDDGLSRLRKYRVSNCTLVTSRVLGNQQESSAAGGSDASGTVHVWPYSYLNASTGSSLEARSAGTMPLMTPTTSSTIAEPSTAIAETRK